MAEDLWRRMSDLVLEIQRVIQRYSRCRCVVGACSQDYSLQPAVFDVLYRSMATEMSRTTQIACPA
jgi:hypothetical protein